MRGGQAGGEYPFDLKIVELDPDEYGDPDTSVVTDWNAAPRLAPKTSGRKKTDKISRIVADLINDGDGELRSPRADMKPVKCVPTKPCGRSSTGVSSVPATTIRQSYGTHERKPTSVP